MEQEQRIAESDHLPVRIALIMCSDLMFAVRLWNMAKKAGLVPTAARTGAELPAGDVLIVDLSERGDWDSGIRRAVARGIPVIAFGPHMDSEGRRRAKEVGATRVLANSNLERDLPNILADIAKASSVARMGLDAK